MSGKTAGARDDSRRNLQHRAGVCRRVCAMERRRSGTERLPPAPSRIFKHVVGASTTPLVSPHLLACLMDRPRSASRVSRNYGIRGSVLADVDHRMPTRHRRGAWGSCLRSGTVGNGLLVYHRQHRLPDARNTGRRYMATPPPIAVGGRVCMDGAKALP